MVLSLVVVLGHVGSHGLLVDQLSAILFKLLEWLLVQEVRYLAWVSYELLIRTLRFLVALWLVQVRVGDELALVGVVGH